MQNLAKKLLVISMMALLITACISIIAKIGNTNKPSIPTTSISVPDSSHDTSDKTSFIIKDVHDFTEEPDEIL